MVGHCDVTKVSSAPITPKLYNGSVQSHGTIDAIAFGCYHAKHFSLSDSLICGIMPCGEP